MDRRSGRRRPRHSRQLLLGLLVGLGLLVAPALLGGVTPAAAAPMSVPAAGGGFDATTGSPTGGSGGAHHEAGWLLIALVTVAALEAATGLALLRRAAPARPRSE